MLQSYKTEINPTAQQIQIINRTIGTCRYVYNFYLDHNKAVYEKENRFVSGKDFSKWLNNEFIPNNPDYSWIKETSLKSTKQSIMNADKAFRRFFKHQSGFPKFKAKDKSDVKMYFVKTDAKAIILCERHRIKIPTLGWVRLKEKNYLPTDAGHFVIKSGTVSKCGNRYYVSVLVEQETSWYKNAKKCKVNETLSSDGVGIDLGIKDLAICSNDVTYKNINKSAKVRKLEKRRRRIQRSVSRRLESNIVGYTGSSATKDRKPIFARPLRDCKNYNKRKEELLKVSQRLSAIRDSHVTKATSEIVNREPRFICIEDLNVKGMMKNKHLSKAVQQQKFYEFRRQITYKAERHNIPLIIADRWFPSSKTCNRCGFIKKDLKLSDRTFICPNCGNKIDRDYQASLNLKWYGERQICEAAS